jgi:hypothetical protein
MLVARSLLSCVQVAALPLCLRAAAACIRTATITKSATKNASKSTSSVETKALNTADICDEHEHRLGSGELSVLGIPFRSFGARTAFHGQAKVRGNCVVVICASFVLF